MTPRRRRASHQAVVRSVLALSVVAAGAACNLITGAGELTPCEGAQCTTGELSIDGAPAIVDGLGSDAADDRSQVGRDGASSGDTPDSSNPDTGTPCPLCEAGACSPANGACQVDSECCGGLKCSTTGKCVSACIAQEQECVFGTCCLGSRCSIIAGYVCAACGLAGTSCNNDSACCSNSCVNGSCVGNVNPNGGLPGGR